MSPFDQIKAFLRQRGSPGIRTMPDTDLDEWLWHHDRQQTLGVIEQPDGTVTGVGVAVRYHGADSEPQGGMWAINREAGDRVWVIEVAASDDDSLMKLCRMLAGRFPGWPKTRLEGKRVKHGRKDRKVSWPAGKYLPRLMLRCASKAVASKLRER